VSEERLNRIEQQLVNIEQRLKTLELDIEPDGRISEGFQYLSDDLDSFREEVSNKFTQVYKRLERLEHGQNRMIASLDVIVKKLTGWSQDN
jgi:hypothetical protein